MVKRRHCAGIKTMIIYVDNTITQIITYNVSRYLNKCPHSSVRSNCRKIQNITIKNGDGETTPLFSEKTSHGI